MRKKPKICLACSAGGHFQQLRLATDGLSREKYDFYWLTMKAKHLGKFFEDKKVVTLTNTEVDHKWTFAVNAVQALWYLIKERPDVIISTGAGVAYPTILFGKMFFRCKIIFVCSAANVTKPSRVPFKAYPISDLFVVQWQENMKFFPNSTYIGTL